MIINEIKEVLSILDKDWDSLLDSDKEKVYDMTMRFARFMPSPSKMNAMSVLKSNSAERLAEWLENEEKVLERYK